MKLYELLDKLAQVRKDIGNEALKADISSIEIRSNDVLVLKFGYDVVVAETK